MTIRTQSLISPQSSTNNDRDERSGGGGGEWEPNTKSSRRRRNGRQLERETSERHEISSSWAEGMTPKKNTDLLMWYHAAYHSTSKKIHVDNSIELSEHSWLSMATGSRFLILSWNLKCEPNSNFDFPSVLNQITHRSARVSWEPNTTLLIDQTEWPRRTHLSSKHQSWICELNSRIIRE